MKSRLLTYLMLTAFVATLALACLPFLETEIKMGADGLSINQPRTLPCQRCPGTATYVNPMDGTEGEFQCGRCGSHFLPSELTR